MKYDILVIGGGPGGYVAAIRAAQLGFKTALVEKNHIGGTCLNVGCIPTKSYVAVAENFVGLKKLDSFGIEGAEVANAKVNFGKIVARKNKIVEGLRAGIQQLIKANKIDYIKGHARFVSASSITVDATPSDSPLKGGEIQADNFIIATGSTWRSLPGLVADGQFVLNSDHILDLTELPKKLLIIGGGVIGCEFASLMNIFGSEVTIVEAMDQILPTEDPTIARTLSSIFTKRGIKIYTKTTGCIDDKKVFLSSGETLEPEKVLISVGRKPNTDGLNIEATGIETRNGFIVVNDNLQTNVPNVYAIGDVAAYKDGKSKPMLAHVASNDGIRALAHIKNVSSSNVQSLIAPSPIFTIPEISSVGMNEKMLKAQGVSYKTGRFAFAAISKAVCDGHTDGLMQAYVGEDGKILGAHFIGNHASDLCAEVTVAMQNGLTAEKVFETIHSHPTYSEIVAETLEDAFGMAIHKASVKR